MFRCPAGMNCVAWLANRSLAWSILNLHELFAALTLAETALARVYVDKNFKLARSGLQADFNKARKRDCEKLMKRLEDLAATSDSNIICTLQGNEGGRPYQLKELTTAFTRHVRIRETEDNDDDTPDISLFLRKTVNALQRISGRSQDYDIPAWAVTSLEVDFDVDDAYLIGRGTFGRVVKGEWNGKVVAVKELSPPNDGIIAMDAIRHEIQIWSSLSHPNILPFYGACLESTKPFIISELCTLGNALKYIKRNRGVNRLKLLYDITSGMVYLHDQGIIHADLKASNILISDAGEALIADFGLSQVQDQVSSSIHITRTSTDKVGGTIRWMAPELLVGKNLNKPADIYSFALTAWEFYTNGAVPFGNIVNTQEFTAHVMRGERPERPVEMGDGMWALIQKCWKSEPADRPDFVQIEKALGRLMARKDQDRRVPNSGSSVARIRTLLSPLDVTNVSAAHPSEKSPTVTPPNRSFSLGTDGDEEKGTFLKGLANNKIIKSPKPPKVACISPKSRHVEKNRPPSDEMGFLTHAQKLPSLSWISAESSPGSSPIDVTLTFLFDHSLTPEGVSEILAEAGLVPAAIKSLLRPDHPENESYLLLGLLANLACHGNGRSAIAAQPESMLALDIFLALDRSESVQESATRCLYNLSTEDGNLRLLVEDKEAISLLGHLLITTLSESIIKNVLGCLTNLSNKELGRCVILLEKNAVEGLIRSLAPDMDDIAKEQALMCIGNLSVDSGVTDLLAFPQLIPRLSMCLCQNSPTPAVKAQTLRCLRNLAKSVLSHTDIYGHPEIMLTVCDLLALHASSNQQRYALHLLHRFTSSGMDLPYLVFLRFGLICSSGLGKEWLRSERSVWGSLRWYVDNGSSENQARANACLKLVQDLL